MTITYGSEREARALISHLIEPEDKAMARAITDFGAVGALDFIREGGHAEGSENKLLQGRIAGRLGGMKPMREVLDRAREQGIEFIIPGDAEFPRSLTREVIGDSAPVGLWVKGRPLPLDDIDKPLAFVGARASSSYGEHVTTELVSAAVASGYTIVSGGAYGIEGAAHRAAMMAGGETVCFQAGGLDRPYPAGHQGMLERIGINGTLVSEVPPGSVPTKWRFLARNRLIAAASHGVVVVEAGGRSGSTETARRAAEFGVHVMAVPGPITSATSIGTNRLIAEGTAELITNIQDIKEVLQ